MRVEEGEKGPSGIRKPAARGAGNSSVFTWVRRGSAVTGESGPLSHGDTRGIVSYGDVWSELGRRIGRIETGSVGNLILSAGRREKRS